MTVMDETARLRHGNALRRLWPGREELITARASDGDREAFAAIFGRYHQDLYRYCRSILRDPDDAEDALQSAMLSALRSLPGERREISLRPWLFKVAHNHAISILRARGREVSVDPALAGLQADGREGEIESRARLRALLEDLELLTERQRAALTLRELSGLSFEEVGEALTIAPQAARQAVYEARLALRALEEGREMQCDAVCELISEGDRRALRGRRVRAHLRACASCGAFSDAIARRRADLAALAPPMGTVTAAALLHSVLGSAGTAAGVGSSGAAAGVLGAGAKGVSTAVVAKAAGSLVAATAIGIGAADRAGLIETPLPGLGDRSGATVAPQAAGEDSDAGGAETVSRQPTSGAGQTRSQAIRDNVDRDGRGGPGGADASSPGGPPADAIAGGRTDHGPPAHSSAGGNPPTHSSAGGNPPVNSSAGGNPPANSSAGGNPPANSSAGDNPPANSSAGDNPPANSSAGSQTGGPSTSGAAAESAAGGVPASNQGVGGPPKPERPAQGSDSRPFVDR